MPPRPHPWELILELSAKLRVSGRGVPGLILQELQLPPVLFTAQLVPEQLNPGLTAAQSQALPESIDLSQRRKAQRALRPSSALSATSCDSGQSHLMCCHQWLGIVIVQSARVTAVGTRDGSFACRRRVVSVLAPWMGMWCWEQAGWMRELLLPC